MSDPQNRIKSFIERAIRLKEQVADLQADLTELYKEADESGLDKAAIKECVKRATMTDKKKSEAEYTQQIADTYWHAYQGDLFEDVQPVSRTRTRTRARGDEKEAVNLAGEETIVAVGQFNYVEIGEDPDLKPAHSQKPTSKLRAALREARP